MRYSICGFNQERVLEIKKEIEVKKGEKTKKVILRLDATDLIILNNIADFFNRNKVIKYVIDSKTFVSIRYNAVIEDLPILDIKKQALRDRIDKMCTLGVLEKKVIKNGSGSWTAFRLGDVYETLKYSHQKEVCSETQIGTEKQGGCVVNYTRGMYSTTHGVCSEIHTNTNILNKDFFTIKDSFLEKENIKEKDFSFDSHESNARDLFSDMAAEDFADYDTPTFDAFWNLYDKKMGKVKVKAKWDKLSKADKKAIMDYLPRYVESTPDKQYRKHPLTFLNQEGWNDEIIEHKTLSTSDYDRKSTSSNVLRTTYSSGDTDPADIKRWEEPARKCVEWMQSNDIHFSMTTQDFRSCYEYVEGCVKAMAAILMQYKGVQFPGFVKLEVDKRRREEPFSSMISEYVREHNSHK